MSTSRSIAIGRSDGERTLPGLAVETAIRYVGNPPERPIAWFGRRRGREPTAMACMVPPFGPVVAASVGGQAPIRRGAPKNTIAACHQGRRPGSRDKTLATSVAFVRQRPMRHFIHGVARVGRVPPASSVALIKIRPTGALMAVDYAATTPFHVAPSSQSQSKSRSQPDPRRHPLIVRPRRPVHLHEPDGSSMMAFTIRHKIADQSGSSFAIWSTDQPPPSARINPRLACNRSVRKNSCVR